MVRHVLDALCCARKANPFSWERFNEVTASGMNYRSRGSIADRRIWQENMVA